MDFCWLGLVVYFIKIKIYVLVIFLERDQSTYMHVEIDVVKVKEVQFVLNFLFLFWLNSGSKVAKYICGHAILVFIFLIWALYLAFTKN